MIMQNKTILITGGATGIDLATAKLLNVEGAKIIVTMSCRRSAARQRQPETALDERMTSGN
jgi:short-subunit dehydrogenase involved in D-alanine esterification of teichoic acids